MRNLSKSILLIAFVTVSSFSVPSALGQVEVKKVEINPANGHSYYLLRGPKGKGISWTEGDVYARSIGGYLTAINDSAENDWILANFTGNAFGDLGDYYVWIGLSDEVIEGQFQWSSGEPLTFVNWYSGEPNDYLDGEDYVHIYNFSGGNYAWNDNDPWVTDSDVFPFSAIAEVPNPAVPESSTLLAGLGIGLIAFLRWLRR